MKVPPMSNESESCKCACHIEEGVMCDTEGGDCGCGEPGKPLDDEQEAEQEDEKKEFLVRQNCEYHVVVEAVDEEDAITQANAIPLDSWSGSWSPLDAEEY
jgi:hypothetical protein